MPVYIQPTTLSSKVMSNFWVKSSNLEACSVRVAIFQWRPATQFDYFMQTGIVSTILETSRLTLQSEKQWQKCTLMQEMKIIPFKRLRTTSGVWNQMNKNSYEFGMHDWTQIYGNIRVHNVIICGLLTQAWMENFLPISSGIKD